MSHNRQYKVGGLVDVSRTIWKASIEDTEVLVVCLDGLTDKAGEGVAFKKTDVFFFLLSMNV